jgi:hypothetical protein
MPLQDLSILQVHGSTLEALTQATLILILGIAIVSSNLLIIATFINYRGTYQSLQTKDSFMMIFCKNFRATRSHQHLLVILGVCWSLVRFINSSIINLSSAYRKLGLRWYSMSTNRLLRSHTVVHHSLHLYVDLGG